VCFSPFLQGINFFAFQKFPGGDFPKTMRIFYNAYNETPNRKDPAMDEEDRRDYAVAGSLIAVGIAGVWYSVRGLRRNAKKHEAIRLERDAQLRAIAVAQALVIERLDAGKYRSIDEAMTDFEFEIIAARTKL
jgi:hypothetical protein